MMTIIRDSHLRMGAELARLRAENEALREENDALKTSLRDWSCRRLGTHCGLCGGTVFDGGMSGHAETCLLFSEPKLQTMTANNETGDGTDVL